MKEEQINVSAYPKGSEWRRWDLHVHTPSSKLGTSFPNVSWADYINALESAATSEDIAVIGVTDYMSIDGYERLYREKYDNNRLSSVSLLIPNIEFRAQPATKDGKALNIHVLVDPNDKDHVQKIKRALKNLKVEYTSAADGKNSYGCIREELIEFGRAQNNTLSDDEQAYKFGIEQFKPSYDSILDWIGSEGWLKSNSLISVANGKDGISGLPTDGFAAVRDELLKSSHFVFSANPRDRDYYLGDKTGVTAEDIVQMYRSLKPCLHGSDAHEISKLFKPDEERNCWIKSDPTFEGLRQTLWEPRARVHIGSSMPQLSDMSRVISGLKITNSNGWFTQSALRLNPGLVGIIGEKGAGKTAIADLIAFASGVPEDSSSQSSFITKGHLHLKNVGIEIEWGSGSSSSGTLTSQPFECSKPLVRYLSQDFVERLCSEDHEGHELQAAIEDVVFSHLDELHKEDYSSFEELRAAREAASHSRQNELRGRIATLNSEIERLHASLGQRDAKVANIEQSIIHLEEVRKQLPAVTEAADEATMIKLAVENERLKDTEGKISRKNRQKRGAEEFIKSYVDLRDRTNKQLRDLIESAQLSEIALPEEIESLYPDWSDKGEIAVRKAAETLSDEIAKLRGDELDHSESTLYRILERTKALEQLLVKDEVNRSRLVDLQKQIASHESSINRIRKEVADLDGKTNKTLAQRRSDRDESYIKYFKAIAEDEKGLRDLYEPMREKLDNLGADMKFELSTGFRVSLKDWLEKATRFFDGRKPAALTKKDEIERHVTEVLSPAWENGDRAKISAAVNELAEIVSPVDFMSKLASPTLKLVDLLDWIYSTDHVQTTYKIKYGGTYLEHLSPGARGIALLVLYLLMDDDDRRPLLIDQPEGNLDNSSIYLQLVPYLRKAKLKRQIILVTHNPNLVVATDAEQIIVATSVRHASQPYPQITYLSGSLEHNETMDDRVGMRQAVCTLLEGGDRAFKEREGRYSIRIA